LWRQVVADAAEQDLELTPIELLWLRSAARMTIRQQFLKLSWSVRRECCPGLWVNGV
jgi:hypothetical protein